jgi:hypothetical protein
MGITLLLSYRTLWFYCNDEIGELYEDISCICKEVWL